MKLYKVNYSIFQLVNYGTAFKVEDKITLPVVKRKEKLNIDYLPSPDFLCNFTDLKMEKKFLSGVVKSIQVLYSQPWEIDSDIIFDTLQLETTNIKNTDERTKNLPKNTYNPAILYVEIFGELSPTPPNSNQNILIPNFNIYKNYYLTDYNSMKDYLEFILLKCSSKTIKGFYSSIPCWKKDSTFAEKYFSVYTVFILFNDDFTIKIDYPSDSLIYIELTTFDQLYIYEKSIFKEENLIDFNINNSKIIDYELEHFSEEYDIYSPKKTYRPKNGDYFKSIVFHLSNKTKIYLCVGNKRKDEILHTWQENNIEKNVLDKTKKNQLIF